MLKGMCYESRRGLFSGLNYGEMRADFKLVESENVSLLHEESFYLVVIPNLLHLPEVLLL